MSDSKKVEFYRQTNRLIKKLRRESISKVNRRNLYPGEFRILSMLRKDDGTIMSEIAKRWSMQSSNVTNTVNSLVDRGYARKEKDLKDKRKSSVFITDKGDDVKNEYFSEFNKKINESLSNVSDESITTALEAINKILEQI